MKYPFFSFLIFLQFHLASRKKKLRLITTDSKVLSSKKTFIVIDDSGTIGRKVYASIFPMASWRSKEQFVKWCALRNIL